MTLCSIRYLPKKNNTFYCLDETRILRYTAPHHAAVAQLVERIHGKDEVTSSILVGGSKKRNVY